MKNLVQMVEGREFHIQMFFHYNCKPVPRFQLTLWGVYRVSDGLQPGITATGFYCLRKGIMTAERH